MDKLCYYSKSKNVIAGKGKNEYVNESRFKPMSKTQNPIIIKGDITLLECDAIVNAANSDGLGCFTIGHMCLDNVIHRKAGPGLRMECRQILTNGPQKI